MLLLPTSYHRHYAFVKYIDFIPVMNKFHVKKAPDSEGSSAKKIRCAASIFEPNLKRVSWVYSETSPDGTPLTESKEGTDC